MYNCDRVRVSAATGDTASNLGSAVDELMRHQPTLKTDATTAIIKVQFPFISLFFSVHPNEKNTLSYTVHGRSEV